MRLSYRLKTREDEPALVRLWAEFGGWDDIDLATWRQRFVETPYGEACTILAEDDESKEIVGQFIFFRFPIVVDGHEIPAMRAFAPIVNVRARSTATFGLLSNPLKQPLARMYLLAMKTIRAEGCHLIFALPDPKWVRFFRIFPPFQCDQFPLWSRPLPFDDSLKLSNEFEVTSLDDWNDEIDRLWDQTSRNHAVSVVRNRRMLQWKLGLANYRLTTLRRHGDLVGLIAARQKGRQWLICDVLTTDMEETFIAALKAACNEAQATAKARLGSPLQKIAILATPAMEAGLRQLAFSAEDYRFPLFVHVLDAAIARRDVAPARWYISAND